MEAIAVGMEEAGRASGQPTRTVWEAVRAGHLETFIVGRRRLARPEAVRKWVDFLEAESRAGRPVKYIKLRPTKVAA